ncbi:MAG: hypothetical protein IV100_02190 [Myxococcales bacterium]|nr:hypothetical protein [Myxococcales bacterium]
MSAPVSAGNDSLFVIRRSLELLARHGAAFLAIFAVFHLPPLAFGMVLGGDGDSPSTSVALIASVLSWSLGGVASALVTVMALGIEAGKPVTLPNVVRQVRIHVGPVLGVGVIAGAAISFGLMLMVIPGLIALAFLCLATPVAVMEGRSAPESIQRSVELMKQGWQGVGLGVLGVTFIGAIAGQLLLTALEDANGALIGTSLYAASSFFGAWTAVATALAFSRATGRAS